MYRFCLIVFLLQFLKIPCALPANSGNDSVPYSAQLLSQYIKHPSITGNERNAGIFFSTVAREKGLYVEILTDEPGSFNFTASLYPLGMKKPNIVFLNHIDVVPATVEHEHKHTFPPFSGAIANGKVWGRGAIDNKGMAVMQLLAMENFVEIAAETDLPFNITLLSVSGEETGGYTGAKIISDHYIEYLNPFAVYGEGGLGIPGVLRRDPDRKLFGVSIAYKRSLWLELTLTNITSGHGAVPPSDYVVMGKTRALNRLLDRNRNASFSPTTRTMINELGRVEGGLRGLAMRNIWLCRPLVVRSMRHEPVAESLITNTIAITSINSPVGAANQIPQEITAVLDCRLLPGTDTEEFIEKIRKVLGNDAIRIRILHERETAPATTIDEYYYYLKEAVETVYPGSAVIPILAPASNDNSYFRKHGIPTYGLLPVFIPVDLIETIHNVDERIPIYALEQGTAVYRELIRIILLAKYKEPEEFIDLE